MQYFKLSMKVATTAITKKRQHLSKRFHTWAFCYEVIDKAPLAGWVSIGLWNEAVKREKSFSFSPLTFFDLKGHKKRETDARNREPNLHQENPKRGNILFANQRKRHLKYGKQTHFRRQPLRSPLAGWSISFVRKSMEEPVKAATPRLHDRLCEFTVKNPSGVDPQH